MKVKDKPDAFNSGVQDKWLTCGMACTALEIELNNGRSTLGVYFRLHPTCT